MVGVTAVGRVVNPKHSGKSLNFALSTNQPMSRETQLITVQVFLERESKIQDYVKSGTLIAVNGQLEISMYEGRKQVRVITNGRSLRLIDTRPQKRGDTGGGSAPGPPAGDPPAAPVKDDVLDDKGAPEDKPW